MGALNLRGSSWCFAVACLMLPALAHGEEISRSEHEAAVTNFQAGRRFVEQNNCRDAIPRFIESLKHEQNVGARFNLAECSRKEGRDVDAWNQYKGAEQLAIQKKDERAADARRAIAELEPKVLKLRLVLTPEVDSVKIDGRAVERTDFGLLETGFAVAPGQPHTIEVAAKNHNPWTKSDVKGPAGGELAAMPVDLGPPLVSAGSKQTTGSGQRVAGLVMGGVGLAGLALGSVFGLLASGARSDAKQACEDGGYSYPSSCNPANKATVDSNNDGAQSKALVSTIAFVAGGALAVGGAVLFFTAPKSDAPTAGRLRLMPALGPTAAGATLGGAF